MSQGHNIISIKLAIKIIVIYIREYGIKSCDVVTAL
nr:MAG TPA: hypothetical protein [Caudoviricetes sp.]